MMKSVRLVSIWVAIVFAGVVGGSRAHAVTRAEKILGNLHDSTDTALKKQLKVNNVVFGARLDKRRGQLIAKIKWVTPYQKVLRGSARMVFDAKRGRWVLAKVNGKKIKKASRKLAEEVELPIELEIPREHDFQGVDFNEKGYVQSP